MRRLLISMMLALLLTLFTAAVAFAQGDAPLETPPDQEDACQFVGDQGAPINEECEVAP